MKLETKQILGICENQTKLFIDSNSLYYTYDFELNKYSGRVILGSLNIFDVYDYLNQIKYFGESLIKLNLTTLKRVLTVLTVLESSNSIVDNDLEYNFRINKNGLINLGGYMGKLYNQKETIKILIADMEPPQVTSIVINLEEEGSMK